LRDYVCRREDALSPFDASSRPIREENERQIAEDRAFDFSGDLS
jgi:hypothetical protein